jgi:hypothetical protein
MPLHVQPEELTVTITLSPRMLRAVFCADALSSGAIALLQLTGSGALASLLGMPASLLIESSFVLVGAAAVAAWLAAFDPVPRGLAWLLIAGNWAWVAGCVALLLSGTASTFPGEAYLVVQAIAVATLAELEWLGVRRLREPGWA